MSDKHVMMLFSKFALATSHACGADSTVCEHHDRYAFRAPGGSTLSEN